ncbi:MAG: hypothetical protein ACOYJX_08850 [Acutalibacteraceae bacterium]|jgi:myosin heavy subunit
MKDLTIKTALFGGFDKKEVLKLIETIQTQSLDESETLRKKDAEIEELKNQIAQADDRAESERRRFSALAALNDDYCERIYNLEEELKQQSLKVADIKESLENLKKIEAKIGTIILEAVIYSEKITERSQQAIEEASCDARHSLISTAQDINELNAELASVSDEFKEDVSVLKAKMEELSGTLNSLAARFAQDSESVDAEEAQAVDELTPPPAEDNAEADMQITPEDVMPEQAESGFNETDEEPVDATEENEEEIAVEISEEVAEKTEAEEAAADEVALSAPEAPITLPAGDDEEGISESNMEALLKLFSDELFK